MKLEFTKMHGLGNDFVVLDATRTAIELDTTQLRFLADRHHGIGCDQVLIVESAQTAGTDFYYRIYNADGNEVEQCGNGARCLAVFVHDRGLFNKDELVAETSGGQVQMIILPDQQVRVNMGVPDFSPSTIPFIADAEAASYTLDVNGKALTVGAVSMGNPHVVTHVTDIGNARVCELGPLIEQHERLPRHANVGFMEIIASNHIRLRVYERGSGETLACGTGACAAVVTGRQQGLLDDKVTVELPGGNLSIQWEGGDAPVWMTGPATHVFDGQIEL